MKAAQVSGKTLADLMTNRMWILLLCAFETTWLVYTAMLFPVAVSMVTRAPEAIVRHYLINLMFVLPVVLAMSALTWAVFIADLARRRASQKTLWILSFLALGMFSLPIYYAVKIRASGRAANPVV